MSAFSKLARPALTAVRRSASVRPTTLSHIKTASVLSARTFTSKTAQQGPEIPVVSFAEGERKEESIKVNENATPVVNPEGVDVEAVTYRLDEEAANKLTPTMKKFLLFGKVAVITG